MRKERYPASWDAETGLTVAPSAGQLVVVHHEAGHLAVERLLDKLPARK